MLSTGDSNARYTSPQVARVSCLCHASYSIPFPFCLHSVVSTPLQNAFIVQNNSPVQTVTHRAHAALLALYHSLATLYKLKSTYLYIYHICPLTGIHLPLHGAFQKCVSSQRAPASYVYIYTVESRAKACDEIYFKMFCLELPRSLLIQIQQCSIFRITVFQINLI